MGKLFLVAVSLLYFPIVEAQCFIAAGRVVDSSLNKLTIAISGQDYALQFVNKADGLRVPKYVFVEVRTFFDQAQHTYFISKKGIDVPLRAMASSGTGLRRLGKIASKAECLKI